MKHNIQRRPYIARRTPHSKKKAHMHANKNVPSPTFLAADKVGMVRVDVRQLHPDDALNHLLRRVETGPEKLNNHVVDALPQAREAPQLANAVLALRGDTDHFLVYKLGAPAMDGRSSGMRQRSH
jgi:hypothetical protein